MEGLFRNCIYQGKNIFREKSFLFWTLIYPIVLAVFFYTGFSGIINAELEKVEVGIDSNNPIIFILEEIELFNIHKMTEDEANIKLEKSEIHGFIDNDLNLLANVLLLIFIKYILNINLLTELKYSLIFIILGNIFGVALGIFIGISNKKSTNTKVLLSLMITLFSSFISGMMSPDVKVLVDKNMPLLARLNPMSIMTNNLYRINLLGITEGVREGIIALSIYSLILIGISYIFLRRRTYDSI